MDNPKHLWLALELEAEVTVALLLGVLNLGGEVGQILDNLEVVLLVDGLLDGVGSEDGSHDGGEAVLLGGIELAVSESDDVGLLDGLAVSDCFLDQWLSHGDLHDNIEDVLGLDGVNETLNKLDVVLEVSHADFNGVLSLAGN